MLRVVFFPTWLLAVLLLLSGILISNAGAEGVSFRNKLTYTNTETDITNKSTGEKIKTDSYTFDQQYNLDISKTIYPYLTFGIGTLFELNKDVSKTEGNRTENDERILRPYVELRLNNPIYRAGIEYRRTEIHEDIEDLPRIENIRDEFNGLLGWLPEELPNLMLRFKHLHTRDDPKTVDTIQKTASLEAVYTAWDELVLYYLYTRSDLENRINNFDTLSQSHFGRVEYSHNFLDERLFLDTSYRIRYNIQDVDFPAGGSAEIPLQRSQGLFSFDNTPGDGPALAVNNGLIDGNLTVSTGIDIGLAGDETTLTNIGLDLGVAVDVDEIHIWVDRSLSAAVANSFSWDVYTSPDNLDSSTWTLVATVFPASFGTFDNRFEIPFTTVNTNFIKVVTTPLSPAVPDAASFPNIFVTEMQAFVTVSGATASNRNTTADHDYDLNLRARLSDKTVVGYSLHYGFLDQDPSVQKRTELSNTAYLNHTFNEKYSTNANLTRLDESLNDEDTVAYTYNASIRGAYLRTFNQVLTYSGAHITEEEGSGYGNSLILRSNAILYRGWSAFLDTGYNWNDRVGEAKERSILIRSGTNFVPNEKITININYDYRKLMKPEQSSRYELYLDAFFVPTRTLSFDAKYRFVNQENFNTTLQNYFVNWSPFPDGDLQFFFKYSETLNSQNDRKERVIGPGLNWTISRHFFLEMFYNIVKTEDNAQEINSNDFYAEFRINF